MRGIVVWRALVLAAIIGAVSAPASAETKECADLRDKIGKMEADGAVRPPGWFGLDSYLRLLYKADCILNPSRPSEPEYWYDSNGQLTGVPAEAGRPENGAYTTTIAIGQACTAEKAGNPSMCAMLKTVEAACRNPRDELQKRTCITTVGPQNTGNVTRLAGGPELPPIRIGLDGGPYNLNPACMGVLQGFGEDLAIDDSQAGQRPQWLATMKANCPDFLDALKRRTGADPDKNPAAFWPAFGEALLSGFAPPGAPQPSIAHISADPGFREMCRQAKTNMDTCTTRQNNMRSIGTEPVGTEGQAGAFNQCRILYGQVYAMCGNADRAAERLASRAPPPAPKPAPPPPQAKPPANPNAPQASQSPPQQKPPMSAQCQKLVSTYVAAAQANDGPAAMAGYNALKKAGGCGVLDKVDHAAAQPAPGQFPSRRATPNIDGAIGACDRSLDGCAEAMRQLEAATSPAAKAALVANAIQVGLELGAAMAGGMAAFAPQGGGNTNYNSIGNRPAQSTHGQGSAPPSRGYQPPPTVPCGPGPVCTAR